MEAPWKIIRLELSKPLDTLSLPEGYRGILAIFCYRGIPLGERNFTDTELAVWDFDRKNYPIV